MENGATDIGKRIRKRRLALRKSQSKIAKAVGISRNQISRYENGPDVPKLDKLGRLSRALGVSVDWLVLGDEGGFLTEDDRRAIEYVRRLPSDQRAVWFQMGDILDQRPPQPIREENPPISPGETIRG